MDHPTTIEQEVPFVLPEHTLATERTLARLKLPTAPSTVGRVGRYVICRKQDLPPLPAAPKAPASETALEESLEFIMLQPENGATAGTLANQARRAMVQLAHTARTGDPEALWRFGVLVHEFADALSAMVRRNPAAWEPLAKHCARWPLMASTAPHNSDPPQWLDLMRLGSALPVSIVMDPQARWKPDRAAQYAAALLEHIAKIRADASIKIWVGRKECTMAALLPDFSPETAGQWSDAAISFLTAAYGENLEEIPELDRLVTAPTKRKSPGRRRQKIRDLLTARIKAYAGCKGS